MLLYPRLPRRTAEQIYDTIIDSSIEEIGGLLALAHQSTTVAATGGNAAQREDLERVRGIILDAAVASGFPDKSTALGFSRFDRECARSLFEGMRIVTADAANPGVWAFIGCVIAPDVICWRFSKRNKERFLGGPRNTFRRLWWRSRILGSSGAALLDQLGEDELVQVMERPTIGGNPRLAVHLCSGFLDVVSANPDVGRMDLMREAAKRIVRLAPSTSLDALDAAAVSHVVEEVLVGSARALGAELGERQSSTETGGIDLSGGPVAPDHRTTNIRAAGLDHGESDAPSDSQAEDAVVAVAEAATKESAPLGAAADLSSAEGPHRSSTLGSFVPFRPSEPRGAGSRRYLADYMLGEIRKGAVDAVRDGASTVDAVIELVPRVLGCVGPLMKGEEKLIRRLLWSAAAKKSIELRGQTMRFLDSLTDDREEPIMQLSATNIASSAFALISSNGEPMNAESIAVEVLGGSPPSRSAVKVVSSVLNSMAVGRLISGSSEGGWTLMTE